MRTFLNQKPDGFEFSRTVITTSSVSKLDIGIPQGSGPLGSGPTGPGSGYSVMPIEMLLQNENHAKVRNLTIYLI